jgi:hypothetical protein
VSFIVPNGVTAIAGENCADAGAGTDCPRSAEEHAAIPLVATTARP